MRTFALCIFAVGMVVSLGLAALCVPLVYTGELVEFGVSVGTSAVCAVCLVMMLRATAPT